MKPFCRYAVHADNNPNHTQDYARTRGIYELAISQPVLDMPELLWKAYIDFEREMEEYDKTRDLYNRLLEKTEHVKVCLPQKYLV